jgi:cytochrome d ubiquinol oxidase subunit I
MHLFAAWMLVVGSNLSAVWIIIANSFMQNPVGFVERNGRFEMVDIFAIIFNSFTGLILSHMLLSAFLLAGFFVMGVAAYHLFKKQHTEGMLKSFKIAMVFAIVGSIGVAFTGDLHGKDIAERQLSKLAAMEAVWDTEENVPFYLFLIPGEDGNKVEALPIPGMVSLLSYGDTNAEVKGLNDFPEGDTPPVGLTFWSFRIMIAMGGLFILLALIALVLTLTKKLENARWFHVLLMLNIPLPYIVIDMGWVVAEVGRQPWIVFGKMRTAEAVSPAIAAGEVWITLIGFILFYSILGIIGLSLMYKYAVKGPESGQAAKQAVSSGEEAK